jgi:hypothetical protein
MINTYNIGEAKQMKLHPKKIYHKGGLSINKLQKPLIPFPERQMAAGILPEQNILALLVKHYCTVIPKPVRINFTKHPLTCTSCTVGNEMGLLRPLPIQALSRQQL